LILPLDCAQIFQVFLEAIFLGAAMEWLLGDKDVWSVEHECRVRRAITFDRTIGSRSNVYRGF